MNNKLIIVEGQDNCGKSTLLRKLRSKIDNPNIITLSSCGPPKNCNDTTWNKNHYSSIFNLMIELIDGPVRFDVLADRFHIGETCYGSLFRNADSEYIWDLEKSVVELIGSNIYLIVLTDDGKAILTREDGLSIEQNVQEFDAIGDLFVDGYNKSNIKNKKLINISNNGWADPEEIYKWIYGSEHNLKDNKCKQ